MKALSIDGYKKLGVLVLTLIIVILNYVLSVNIPTEVIMSLIGLSAAYVLGQSSVDGKKAAAPVTELSSAITTLIQTELAKTNTTLPLDDIMILFKSILTTELSKINTFTLVPVAPVLTTPIESVPDETVGTSG